jgi:hypothetical protein
MVPAYVERTRSRNATARVNVSIRFESFATV